MVIYGYEVAQLHKQVPKLNYTWEQTLVFFLDFDAELEVH